MDSRPDVPLGVKRQLRQEASFGCCVCGHPILQFHHIVRYATERHFRPEDMMALCPNHHDEANALVLSEPEQRAFKLSPFNKTRGFAAGQLAVDQIGTDLNLGGYLFRADAGDVVRIAHEPILRTALSPKGTLLLTASLYDEADILLVEIIENEWISHVPLPWEIEFRYRELKIRSAPRMISLSLDSRKNPVLVRGELWRAGRKIRIDDEGFHADDAHLIGGGEIHGFVLEVPGSGSGQLGLQLVPGNSAGQPPPQRVQATPKVGRNDTCPCGSGLKYKRCHGR